MSIHKIKDEINGIKKWEGKNKREDLKYRTNIIKVTKSLEDSAVLIDGVTETVKL